MNWMKDHKWFAVQAKPHQENLAATVTSKLDIEVFLPKVRQEQSVCGVTRLLTKPLFQGYFFARFCPSLSLEMVRHALGVLRVVGTRHYPLPLESHIIADIQERVQSDGFIRLETKHFQPGDKVKIEQGPLSGWMGQVEREWDNGKRVMILLKSFSQARVVLEKSSLTVQQIA